ncbi:MAG: hypothetical protein GY696_36990 [Gammaproteobacteria bacterium]|nr:hypothetical protein [Gammaproteobacteria bacterium]
MNRRDICLAPRPGVLTRKSCCCTMGQAWGADAASGDCEECPADGSAEFLKLCPGGMGRGEFGEDYNECEMMADLCKNGRCINTDGSYRFRYFFSSKVTLLKQMSVRLSV